MTDSNSKRVALLTTALAVLAKRLPGDHIHHVAPTSKQSQSSMDKVAALDAAQAKRNRKNAKRRKA